MIVVIDDVTMSRIFCKFLTIPTIYTRNPKKKQNVYINKVALPHHWCQVTRTLGIGSSHTLPCYLGEGQLGGGKVIGVAVDTLLGT